MVIAQNDMDFYPDWEDIRDNQGDSCSIQWRISQVGCWTDWVYDPTAPIMEKNKKPRTLDIDPNEQFRMRWTIYEPCDTTICCARQLKVCRHSQYGVEMTDLGLLTDYVDCEGLNYIPPAPYPTVDCEYTCDVLENYDDSGLGKTPEIKIDTLNKDFENLEHTKHFEINVSQNDNILTVFVQESNANNIIISLYNINGQLILNKEETITKGLNRFDLDLNKLTSGSYFHSIVIDGILVEKDKVIIVK